MKIRTGFVSNSSSSSFVVRFPRIPTSAEDCKEIMFPDGLESITAYHDSFSTARIAEQVYHDILEQLNSDNVQELARNIAEEGLYNAKYYGFSEEEYLNNSPVQLAIKVSERKRAEFVFDFTYADDSGPFECTMEHGQIFRNLPHEYESNH